MTASNYQRCLRGVLRHEGGYVDHPKDPGGATNKGITIGTLSAYLGRKATKQDVRNISDETVARIYHSRYWSPVRGDSLVAGFDFVTFDGAVNSGPPRGVKWMQSGVGVKADGKVGPKTIEAVRRAGIPGIQRACAKRMGFLQGLRTWKTFGRGWSRRVAETEAEAVAMFSSAKGESPVATSATLSKNGVRAGYTSRKQIGSGAASAAGGGGASSGGISIDGLPDNLVMIVGAVLLIGAVLIIIKGLHNRRRADAYQAKATEVEHEL